MRQCKNDINTTRQQNKNVRGERLYNIEGMAFASQSFLSTPPAPQKNSFCPDPHKNCVVHVQLHKKQASNCLYLHGLLRSRTIIGRDQWNNFKVII